MNGSVPYDHASLSGTVGRTSQTSLTHKAGMWWWSLLRQREKHQSLRQREMANCSTEDGIHPRCDLDLALLKDMPVGVRGQDDRAVAQEVLDVFKREALRQQECRRGMAEVMEVRAGEVLPAPTPAGTSVSR